MESCKKALTFSVHKSYIRGAKGGICMIGIIITNAKNSVNQSKSGKAI